MREQRTAADFIVERISDGGGIALFAQQRTGKTYITCAVIERLKPRLTLVIAPLTAVDVVWRKALTTLDTLLMESPQELRSASNGIYLTHYQGAVKNVRVLARKAWSLVVIDESQGIKSRSSAQSRMARKLRGAERRLALSGTPIDQSPIDVWAQMRFVDHTVLGEDWTPFADRYCYKGGFKGRKWIFDSRKTDDFLNELKGHVYRLTTDFMGLKPISVNLIPVTLLGEQERLYQRMEEHGIVRIGAAVVTGSIPVTKLAKLEQITGGFILDDANRPHRVGFAKERKLRWLLSRLTFPVVIFCKFLTELHHLSTALSVGGHRVGVLWGHVKGENRVSLIDDFQSGKFDILIAQMRTGSVSVSFTRSNTLVLYSINHSFIDFEQMMFRLQGMTQEREVQAHIIYCENTVDEDKINRIKAKESTVYRVVSHFERKGNGCQGERKKR